MNTILEQFYNNNSSIKWIPKPVGINPSKLKNWIYEESGYPYFKIYCDLPYEKMFQEGIDCYDYFVDHRLIDNSHFGWKSVCLHGISSEKTLGYEFYGFDSDDATPYIWTEIAEKCPTTVEWLKSIWTMANFKRVRFMMLEPGGYIIPHNDCNFTGLHATNIALNNPYECNMVIENYGIVPWNPGNIFMLDLSNNHCVWNKSNERRLHMIIHGSSGIKSKIHNQLIENSYYQFLQEFGNE